MWRVKNQLSMFCLSVYHVCVYHINRQKQKQINVYNDVITIPCLFGSAA